MKQSAGVLLFRNGPSGFEVLIVHPAGNYNRKSPWSIPKGEVEGDADLEETARRETREETGLEAGELVELGSIDYKKSKKRVHCFAARADDDAKPNPDVKEVDQARFVPLAEAEEILHPDQRPFLARLKEYLLTQCRPSK